MKVKRLLPLLLMVSTVVCSACGECKYDGGIGSNGAISKDRNFILSKGAGELTLGGILKEHYTFTKNPVFLNNNLPDWYSFSTTIIELESDYRWGGEKFGHDAITARAKLRHKGYWGDAPNSGKTDKEMVAISETTLGEHYHAATKPQVWFKELWACASVDALCGLQNNGTHKLKVGYLPFMFGRGISLGSGYGTPKSFLGVYQRLNDYYAPGVLYSGRIYDGKLEYDLYYAKFEDKSTDVKQVMQQTKAHRLDVSVNKAWAGSGNDDELWGFQVKFVPTDDGEFGKAHIAPYLFINVARDKKVEMIADSRSDLITVGCSIEYERGGFECGGEVAFNRGKERMYSIDRNTTEINRADNGVLTEYYSHILDASAGNKVAVSTALKSELATDLHRRDSSFVVGSTTYYNASDRIREQYDNKYRGWMGVCDMAYTLRGPQIKLAACCGWASGDDNPNASETTKEYKGFVGLNELYSGKRVKSVFMLDGRTLKRPLTFNTKDNTLQFAGSDGSFTDMMFIGYGASYKPETFRHKNVTFQNNSMMFWKDKDSYKAINGEISDVDKASKFLGSEVNVIVSAEVLKNLKVMATGAIFFPGTYYKDIKGTNVSSAVLSQLDVADLQNVDTTNYGMGNDTAFFFKMGFEYIF